MQAVLREHPKGLKSDGKGGSSRRHHKLVAKAAIVVQSLKVRRQPQTS